ncbi:hypothetical protein C1I98_00970 [Spongiactinospora gelatinilytica]|uniref:Uncharacterized protein n=1 Tax=Spongiactinospora gelatinilytica TaxID=2666298 RepID=A0A2W2HNH9_9ACTN|nr:hypothetical protein [Spongiactinospora gelatinilytica]PZG56649.1 hypothetical protein C1I98_00970 [Spongiactinospora gelatinilytica]
MPLRSSARLRTLAEHMRTLGWRTGDYVPAHVEGLADMLHKMSIHAAMTSDDAAVAGAVLGRNLTRVGPNVFVVQPEDAPGAPSRDLQ